MVFRFDAFTKHMQSTFTPEDNKIILDTIEKFGMAFVKETHDIAIAVGTYCEVDHTTVEMAVTAIDIWLARHRFLVSCGLESNIGVK